MVQTMMMRAAGVRALERVRGKRLHDPVADLCKEVDLLKEQMRYLSECVGRWRSDGAPYPAPDFGEQLERLESAERGLASERRKQEQREQLLKWQQAELKAQRDEFEKRVATLDGQHKDALACSVADIHERLRALEARGVGAVGLVPKPKGKAKGKGEAARAREQGAVVPMADLSPRKTRRRAKAR